MTRRFMDVTVALDLGGVLVDVDVSHFARAADVPDEVLARAFFASGLHDRLATGRVDPGACFAALGATVGAAPARLEAAWRGVVSPAAGAAALLDAVDAPLVVWSNTDPVHMTALRNALPALARRAVVCGLSYELGALKPDGAFFAAALRAGSLVAGRVVFLDDRADNVAAARAAGVRAARVEGVAEAWETLATHGLARPRTRAVLP
jgi:HAD superfamily hydrolase (TIGR01509 family)